MSLKGLVIPQGRRYAPDYEFPLEFIAGPFKGQFGWIGGCFPPEKNMMGPTSDSRGNGDGCWIIYLYDPVTGILGPALNEDLHNFIPLTYIPNKIKRKLSYTP